MGEQRITPQPEKRKALQEQGLERERIMLGTKPSIMTTLFFSMSQGQNHVSYSSIDTIRKNLKQHHKKDIKRRWTFQVMKDLTDEGLIRRRKRYKNDHNGLINQIPSMIWFTLKGVVWLVKMGVKDAKKIYKSMVTYLEKQDKRSPTRKEFDDGSWKPEDPEFRAWLENKYGIVTKEIS